LQARELDAAQAALAAVREGANNNTNDDSNYNSTNNDNSDNSSNDNSNNINNSDNSDNNNDDSRRGLQAACDLEEDSNAVCDALARKTPRWPRSWAKVQPFTAVFRQECMR
jgi:hypothetical protein